MAQASPSTAWWLTDHAVERFHQRFAADLDLEQARARLAEIFAAADVRELPGDDHYGRPGAGALVYRLIAAGPPPVSFRFLGAPKPEHIIVITILTNLNRRRLLRQKAAARRRRRGAP